PAFREHLELCLVCRNCESVCPSGVHFGRIMEAGRAQLYERADLSAAERVFRRVAFKELLPHRARLRALFAALLVYQRSGLERRVAADLARQNLRAFLGRGLDAIIVNSAGCGATMKEYSELLSDESEAREFAGLTRDITEFLASISVVPPRGTVNREVTLQES